MHGTHCVPPTMEAAMTQIQTLPAPLTIGFVEGAAVPKTIDSGAATPWAQAVASMSR